MATRCDLNGILENIRALLTTNNTTTASPIDLSANLSNSRRVQKLLKVHPEMIPIQPSHYPYVTCYIDEKVIDIEKGSIARDQLQSLRAANPIITIVGGVWNPIISNVNADPADTDIHYLMENVELILRSDPTLSGAVKWQYPTQIQYFSGRINEQTHLRAGVMTLRTQVLTY